MGMTKGNQGEKHTIPSNSNGLKELRRERSAESQNVGEGRIGLKFGRETGKKLGMSETRGLGETLSGGRGDG